MSQAFLVLGDQLFPRKNLLKDHLIILIEDYSLCTHFKYHKQKLVLFLSAMRHYASDLKAAGYQVVYHELSQKTVNCTYEETLKKILKKHKIKKLSRYEIEDHFFAIRMRDLFEDLKIEQTVVVSPGFLSTRENFKSYLNEHKKPFMKTFYEGERRRLNVLMDQGKPLKGQFSFDDENRKKLPKDTQIPERVQFKKSEIVKQVQILVEDLFTSHPGQVDDFNWAVTRKQALKLLNDFTQNYLNHFGDYQDALTSKDSFVFHSLLSPSINMGLITPDEVLQKVTSESVLKKVPYNCIEGFVRQVMGWREFVRGIYHNFDKTQQKENFWNHKRSFKSSFLKGKTGLLPLDLAIQKANKTGYCHHIERLMVLANIMLLAEIHPQKAYQWFMENFVDSADWVMGPNVFGMGLFSDGGLFATKPYICGSNYILKMSDYKKGDWCDVMDGLYWRFIQKHEKYFSSQPRLSMMVRMLNKMDDNRRKHIFQCANTWLKKHTSAA